LAIVDKTTFAFKKILKKINELIRDIELNGNTGVGKPEAIKHELSGFWSRRITEENRLIYSLDEKNVGIVSCRGHYQISSVLNNR